MWWKRMFFNETDWFLSLKIHRIMKLKSPLAQTL